MVSSQMDVPRLVAEIGALKQKAEASSYTAVASELGDMNGRLQTILPRLPLQDASTVMQAFYPLIFEGMVELTQTDENLQNKLGTVENVTYALKVEEVGFTLALMLQDRRFSYSFGEPASIDVTMKTSPEALVRIMTGQTDALEAFMMGEVKAEGSLIKARGLRFIFETMSDKFGFTLMQFST
jgi:putative sterol carrier protein